MVRTYLVNERRADFFKNLSVLRQIENISNVRFVTKDGEVLCQKLFLLSAFPFLREWLCDFCYYSHEEMTFILPEYSKQCLEKALDQVYINCDAEKILYIFGFSKTDKSLEKAKTENSFIENVKRNGYALKEEEMPEEEIVKTEPVELEYKEDVTGDGDVTGDVACDGDVAGDMADNGDNVESEHKDYAGLLEKWRGNDKRCTDCGLQIKHRQNVKRHYQLNCLALGKIVTKKMTEIKNTGPFNCEHCHKIFKRKKAIMKHRRDMHMSMEDILLEFFHCSQCNFSCESERFLKVHVTKYHIDIKPLSCNVCSLKYATKDSLGVHKKNKHPQK